MKEALYNIATSNPLAMFGSDRGHRRLSGPEDLRSATTRAQSFTICSSMK